MCDVVPSNIPTMERKIYCSGRFLVDEALTEQGFAFNRCACESYAMWHLPVMSHSDGDVIICFYH